MTDSPLPRVLHVCAVDFTLRQFISPFVLDLQARGWPVQAACTPGPHWEELRGRGLNLVPLEVARRANPVLLMQSARELAGVLQRERIEILHCHTPVGGIVGRIAGRMARTPRALYTAHGFYFHEHTPRAKRLAHITLERSLARLHDRLICVSREDAQAAVQLGIERRQRITWIPNGVRTAEFDPSRNAKAGRTAREELGIPPDAPVITILGRVTREKGHFEFMEAAEKLAPEFPEARFLIVGEALPSERDRIEAELRAMADRAALRGRMIFAGFRTDVPALLAASTIFALPSWREGMPVSLLEAMMSGLPCVATNIRGCREEVRDGATGFLVPPRNGEVLADAVQWMLSHPDDAKRMGERGRRRALRLFTEERMLACYRAVYDELRGELRS